ncbi:MAG TPA: NAD(P)/FAD-dependent oxidoreductase [Candidatus Mediterraneibacter intestinipullorum]|nr:NAD(P)/FAD-dependent oxidoreductase [Candidatus Mediterraneibacter intestinipullorum]
MRKVLVVGGGAAGMMAAVTAARNGGEVLLIEKNEKLGKKLFITGKGRCNITNSADIEDLFSAVVSNPKFLYSGFYSLTNDQVIDFFEGLGVKTKVERGGRVFPESDHSSDVIRALEQEMKRLGVEVSLQSEVKEILTGEGRAKGVLLSSGKKLYGDAVIIATGGISYPSTGSTGDGYRFARSCGHKVTDLFPSLVPMEVKEWYAKELMGLSLRNIEIRITDGKKSLYEEFGEMLFTHYGVTGPVILSASSIVGKLLKERELKLHIDLKPALTEEQLDKRVLREFEANHNRQFKNAVDSLFPTKLKPVVIELSGIPEEKKVNEITKEERKHFVHLIKDFNMTLTGLRGYNAAIITKGGVSVKEIDPGAMESKLVKELYFAGEVLDLDAVTGGYNLQIAWSTGYLAGLSAGVKRHT